MDLKVIFLFALFLFPMSGLWRPCRVVVQFVTRVWTGCLCVLWYEGKGCSTQLGGDSQYRWPCYILGESQWTQVSESRWVNANCTHMLLYSIALRTYSFSQFELFK